MRRLLGLLLVSALLAVSACSGDDDGSAPPASSVPPAGSATTSVTPGGEADPEPGIAGIGDRPASWEEGDCPVPVPAEADVEVTCGVLSVPENRDVEGSATIGLSVARIHSRSANPGAPIVGLGGGPGYPEVANLAGLVGSPLLDDHDYIAWDLRGTGFSTPSLDCPETNEATWEVFRTTDDDAVEGTRLDDALAACRDRLVGDGVDLDGYDTTQVVADLDDLRTALGIDEWNLYGGSYGTSVALEALRQDLPGIRSVLLDSVEPPDQPFGAIDRGKSAQRAFAAVTAACNAQPTCVDSYGDLDVLVAEATASLDADPYRGTVTDPATGEQREIALTGRDFTAGLFRALYDPSLLGAVPAAVAAVAGGDRAIIGTLAGSSIPFAAGAAEAMTTSINCADRGRLMDAEAVAPFLAEHPELAALIYVQHTEARCPMWDVEAQPAAFNALPAPATVPVMVAAGAFDPITPPEGAEAVADALGVELLTFPDAGHGAIGPSPCSVQLYRAFLDDPEAELDTSCIADLAAPTFG